MIGLTLVTVVAVLGAGLRASTTPAVTDQVQRRLRARRRRRACRSGPPRATTLAERAGRDERLARARPDTALVQGEEGADQRHRPGDDRALLQVRRGPRAPSDTLGAARERRRDRHQGLRRERGPEGRQRAGAHDARRATSARSSSAGIYDPPQAKQLLGRRQHDPAGVRRGLRAARRTATRSSTRTPRRPRRWRPPRRASATPSSTPAPSIRQGRHEGAWPRSWRCSTCCSASR